jgi:hypothetical protein
VDFVKSVNKLPPDQNGDRPLILFASIRLLQAMRHWTIERQRCELAIVHNGLTQDELERILKRMEEVESITDMKPIPPPLPEKFGSFGKNWRIFWKASRDIAQWFVGICTSRWLTSCVRTPLLPLSTEPLLIVLPMNNLWQL